MRSKLAGVNPCVVMREDLVGGVHGAGRYVGRMCEVVMGAGGGEGVLRARLVDERGERSRLTCEEQVSGGVAFCLCYLAGILSFKNLYQ